MTARLRAQPSVTPAATRILFGTALGGPGRVEIVDALGRVVRRLLVPARTASMSWDGQGTDERLVPSGVYLIRLIGLGSFATGRVTVVH